MMEHSISLKDRSNLVIYGVDHIYSFNDKKVELLTSAGRLIIEGEGLDMNKLNLEESIISVDGTVNSLNYEKEKKPDEKFWKKVFK
ncbi:YabP/YqfC family sporulation protein [Terrisporobacter sp.]|jgi:sporulation protein YabP|uniref:YabP/YqfC family sporulation protein n=2 Tax=Terrisporobacter sp. TaxID=1965305 RepID=UPI002A82422E|nr:YabP/YqfC family sporulation protein [Terrisporobacter sp.]MCI5630131.1 sporulation protein YabP [Clostridium sp.]